MSKIKLLCFSFLSVIILAGCSSNGKVEYIKEPVYIEKPVVHPKLPDPVNFTKRTPEIVTKETIKNDPDNVVYQCFKYEYGQDFGVSLAEFITYVTKLKLVLCKYRDELNEEQCKVLDALIDNN